MKESEVYPRNVRLIIVANSKELFDLLKAQVVQQLGKDIENQILWFQGLNLLPDVLKAAEGASPFPNLELVMVDWDVWTLKDTKLTPDDLVGRLMDIKCQPSILLVDFNLADRDLPKLSKIYDGKIIVVSRNGIGSEIAALMKVAA